MGERDDTLALLRRIDSKLDTLFARLAGRTRAGEAVPQGTRLQRAADIAAMTPSAAEQTDAVEMLRQDRGR